MSLRGLTVNENTNNLRLNLAIEYYAEMICSDQLRMLWQGEKNVF